MGREARIQRALAGTPVPVPKVILQEASGDLLGVPFYVMEKVPGHVIRAELPDGYAETPAEKLALTDALVDVLADLHAVDPEAIGLGGYGRPHGYLERQLRRWNGQWEKTKTHEVRAVDELGGRLARLRPESQRASIVHGDYRAAGSMAGQDFGHLDQEVLKIAEEGLSRLREE